ncbi:hybrid sensor histidine kinase/response regulator [bacterium]|jgi:two-component system, cell cycle sensor histidine kinase and response regulator CckA|nr:hybrid sensor histidine kinase/response regulator [bacterium]
MLDQGQIRDVLINLISNSMVAIDSLSSRAPKESFVRRIGIHVRLRSKEILIEVWDTGIGIEEKFKSQIFDPFFSTRGRGVTKGTGLGLAMVYSCVQNHQGRIQVQSYPENGKRRPPSYFKSSMGTIIKIHLPLQLADGSEILEDPPGEGESLSTDALIYVVDDEESYRTMIGRALSAAGFQNVEVFGDGLSALNSIENLGHSPKLIVSDLQMPPPDGIALVEKVKALGRKETPSFVISSGKMTSDSLESLKKLGVTRILSKPYSVKELLRVVKESVDQGLS